MEQVLSFDGNKVKLLRLPDGRRVVQKETTALEYEQLVGAGAYLHAHPIRLAGGVLPVQAVKAAEWRPETSLLVTEFQPGPTLESLLLSAKGDARNRWLEILREFLIHARNTGFLWGDCAPRNMIMAPTGVWLFDFERPLILHEGGIGPVTFSRYLRNYTREEFAAFLFAEEQKNVLQDFLEEERQAYFSLGEIRSTRKRALLAALFGPKDIFSTAELQCAEDLMCQAATPFWLHGEANYPIFELHRQHETLGVAAYVNLVRRLRGLKSEDKWGLLVGSRR